MRTSPRGIAFICSWEGFRRFPYNDGARPLPGHATIGYGTLLHRGPVTRIDRLRYPLGVTKARARKLMGAHLSVTERQVADMTRGCSVTQPMFDALTSFAYNEGEGALRSSTLLRLICEGHSGLAAREFQNWDKAGGVVLPGLSRRRAAEHDIYAHGIYKENQ